MTGRDDLPTAAGHSTSTAEVHTLLITSVVLPRSEWGRKSPS